MFQDNSRNNFESSNLRLETINQRCSITAAIFVRSFSSCWYQISMNRYIVTKSVSQLVSQSIVILHAWLVQARSAWSCSWKYLNTVLSYEDGELIDGDSVFFLPHALPQYVPIFLPRSAFFLQLIVILNMHPLSSLWPLVTSKKRFISFF